MAGVPQDVPPSDHKDRRVGLIVFGLGEIALGLLAGLFAIFQVLMFTLPGPPTDPTAAEFGTRFYLFSAAFYVFFAALFVWIGVGSIQCRRWARDLSLVCGWLWLVLGGLGLLGLIVFFPAFSQGLAEASTEVGGSDAVMKMIMAFMIGFYLAFNVLLPAAIVLFFRSRHVKATCQVRDPKARWTERCPLPVLALSVFLGFGAFQCILSGFSPFRGLPLFGVFVGGTPALIGLLVLGLVMGYLAWSFYRLDAGGWRAAVALFVLGWTSAVITFLRVSPQEILEVMDLPQGSPGLYPEFLPPTSTMVLPLIVGGIGWLGYLWYVRRYFDEGDAKPN